MEIIVNIYTFKQQSTYFMTTKDAIQALGDYVLQNQNSNGWNGCALAGAKDKVYIGEW